MKLYFATGTCSLAPHIALRETGLPFELVRYDMKTGTLENGVPLSDINDKGYVPVLELDSGERLSEVAAILQYIGDLAPQTGLVPASGMPRYRLQEWLNFIGTELHKAFWPLFHEGAEIEKQHARERLTHRFSWVEKKLGTRPFLIGETFTVADAYLLVVLNWTRAAGIDLATWPNLKEYWRRLRDRPAVRAALEAEGLVKRA